MSKAFVAEFFRAVFKSFGRFLSLVAIVCLGVSFYVGIKASSPDMRKTADDYYDGLDFHDVRIVSTLGLDKEDITALQNLPDVERLIPAFEKRAVIANAERNFFLQVISYSCDNAVNTPKPFKGRLPEKSGEIFLDGVVSFVGGWKLGDTLELSVESGEEIGDSFHKTSFTLVGVGESPLYISGTRDTGSAAEGVIDGFAYIPFEDFSMEVYTSVYIKSRAVKGISRFDDEFEKALEPLKDELKLRAEVQAPFRLERVKADGNAALEEARAELGEGEQKLRDAEQKLADGEKEYGDGKVEYDKNKKLFDEEIKKGQKTLEDSRRQLDEGNILLAQKKKEYDEGLAQYNAGLSEYTANKKAYDDGVTALAGLQAQIQALQAELSGLTASTPEYLTLEAQINLMIAEHTRQSAILAASEPLLAQAKITLDQTKIQMDEGKAKLDEGFAQSAEGRKQLEEGKAELAKQKREGEAKLSDAEAKLEEGYEELVSGRKEFEEEKAKANPDIIKAREDIAKAQKDLDALKTPKWHILDPNQNVSFADYKSNCERLAAISQIFPLIFFLVAVLVSLTGMTRMVENDRQQIGILKALGYGKGVIASKYVAYALAAGILGCGLGYAFGFTLLPRLIADAYGILYHLPTISTPFHPSFALASGLFALACVALPALMVCLVSLKEAPAALTVAKAPPPGKRIWLEYITPIWRRISFTRKVTLRNLFRYKKRLLMTVTGIAGCTALLYTGFGLQYAVSSMVPVQFNEIRKYDMDVGLDTGLSAEQLTKIKSLADSHSNIENALFVHLQSVDVIKGTDSLNAELETVTEPERITEMIALRERKGGKPLTLTDDGVIITEKISSLRGIEKGDTITLRDADNNDVTVTVTGIAENYVFHYVYMTDTLYEKLYGQKPEYNQIFGDIKNTKKEAEKALSEELKELDGVVSVGFNTSLRENFDNMIQALVMVVIVLIISAAALAVVVLLSLTGINIDERSREIATLKVLGFQPGETALYVFSEGLILSAIGGGAGLVFGYFLQRFVTQTAEMDMIMFVRGITVFGMILSFVLTMVFSFLAHMCMLKKLRKIDMVSSLKSVD